MGDVGEGCGGGVGKERVGGDGRRDRGYDGGHSSREVLDMGSREGIGAVGSREGGDEDSSGLVLPSVPEGHIEVLFPTTVENTRADQSNLKVRRDSAEGHGKVLCERKRRC